MERHERHLDGLASRRDLDLLFRDMLGELTVSHLAIFAPPAEGEPRKGGLLGADYDGRELRASGDLDEWLSGAAGHTVRLRVARSASGAGARTVPVVPVATERQLRGRAWAEQNRKRVEALRREANSAREMR